MVPLTRVTDFEPRSKLILIAVDMLGPRGPRRSRFVFDTGCTETLVSPEVIDELGYSARDGESTSTISSPIGQERGFMLRVARIAALGHTFTDFRVGVHDLSDRLAIDGLLGLSFLRHFNYEVRSREGRILTALA